MVPWPSLQDAVEAVKVLGWTKGVFLLFFWIAHLWLYLQYHGRLKDRQREVDRLAQENHEYRDKFLKTVDEAQKFISRQRET